MRLGELIVKKRKEKGYTQKYTAILSGVSATVMCMIESRTQYRAAFQNACKVLTTVGIVLYVAFDEDRAYGSALEENDSAKMYRFG